MGRTDCRCFRTKCCEVSERNRVLGKLYDRFHRLYSSLDIITVIKSRWIRYTAYVAHMRWMRNTCKILVIITHGKRQLEDLATEGRLTLKYIFKKRCEGVH
jgi:hypothetical protein